MAHTEMALLEPQSPIRAGATIKGSARRTTHIEPANRVLALDLYTIAQLERLANWVRFANYNPRLCGGKILVIERFNWVRSVQ